MNDALIDRICAWDGPPGTPNEEPTPFWAAAISSVLSVLEKDIVEVTCIATNGHWFEGAAQVALTETDFAVYGTYSSQPVTTYDLLARLPLTDDRDALIAAVRVVCVLVQT